MTHFGTDASLQEMIESKTLDAMTKAELIAELEQRRRDRNVLGGVTLPVPEDTVAVLKLPAPISELVAVTTALQKLYRSKELFIRTDSPLQGWLVICKPAD